MLLLAVPAADPCVSNEPPPWARAVEEASAAFRIDLSTEPGDFVPGRETTVRIRVVDRAGRPVTKFEDFHSKAMHFIVASEDLVDFRHLHPEVQPDGSLLVKTTFPRNVAYEIAAEFDPEGPEGEQTVRTIFNGSAPAFAHSLETEARASKDAEYRSELPDGVRVDVVGTARLRAGEAGHLTFSLRDRAGRPLTDLQPLMGMPGHLIVFSEDRKTFQHLHGMGMETTGSPTIPMPDHATEIDSMALAGMGDAPSVDPHAGHSMGSMGSMPSMTMTPPAAVDPHAGHGAADAKIPADVGFELNVPAPGRYKIWGQFQRNGEVITADFTIDVER